MTKKRTDETAGRAASDERRRVLQVIGAGGAAILLPWKALAQAPPADGPKAITMGPSFRAVRGAADRMLVRGESAPAQDSNGARWVVDVHRDSAGDVHVQWGTETLSVGSAATALAVQIGNRPARPVQASGKTTFKLEVLVEIGADGSVSLIGPGGDPQ